MLRQIISSSLALILFSSNLLLASPIYAQTSPQPTLGPKAQQFCDNLTKGIETLVARYNNNKADQAQKYLRFGEILKNINEKLKAAGYDTSKTEADYQTLNQKILKAADDYSIFIAKLEESKQFTCGLSQGQFASKLAEARELAKTVRLDILDIDNYYQTVVRPDVKALKNQQTGEQN